MPVGFVASVISTCLSAMLIAVLDMHGALLRAWVIGIPLALFINLSLTPLDLKLQGQWNAAEDFWRDTYRYQQTLATAAAVGLVWPALLPYRLLTSALVIAFGQLEEPRRCACGRYAEPNFERDPTSCQECVSKRAVPQILSLGGPNGDD